MSFNQRNDYHHYPTSDQDHTEKITNAPLHAHIVHNRSESTQSVAVAGSQREEELFRLLNSSKPKPPKSTLPIPPPGTNITDEDLAFLKAASEVVKIHEKQIDPTIRDILNRLQYSNSPHGGLPISRKYLQRIDQKDDLNYSLKNTEIQKSSSNISTISADHHSNYTYKNGNDQTLAEPAISNTTKTHNDPFLSHHNLQHNQLHHLQQHHQQQQHKVLPDLGNSPTNFIVPPFTENPLRNPPSNLDFPQFSLDIFKTDELSYPTSNHIRNGSDDDSGDEGVEEEYEDGDGDDEDENENDSSDNKQRKNSKQLTTNKDSSDDVTRNFKCSECSISFKRSSDLKRHEKIHLKTPPNVCPQCHKGFARRDALKRHVGTMTCKRNRERLLEQMKENGETPL